MVDDRAFAILGRFEEEAAEISELNVDTRDVLEFLAARGIPSALVTRNSRRSTDCVLRKHAMSFRVVVTREDAPVKPRPEPLWLICEKLGVAIDDPGELEDIKRDVAPEAVLDRIEEAER